MNRAFSVYLDLVRFVAACLVYVYHSNQRLITHDVLPASHYGHSSVIVFFVLSGFVIAYVTDTKERTWEAYASSRLSRVYSVAAPAVLLTLALDAGGRALMPELYQQYPFDRFVPRAMASLLMANEVWFLSVTSFSNVPYWSIGYETWYYVAFGLAMFLPRKVAVGVLLLIAFLLGPKIVLLAPIWVSGVILYRWQAPQRMSIGLAWLLLVGSILGTVAFHMVGLQDTSADLLKSVIGSRLHDELTFSKFFLSDYVLMVLVFANFAAMRRLAPATAGLWTTIERPVRSLAAYTFTLYLLHQPLFLFWAAVIRGDAASPWYWLAVTAAMAVSVAIVGRITEARRHDLRRWFAAQFARWRIAPLSARRSHDAG